jgi:hypothetical protein
MARRGCHGYPAFYTNAAQGQAEVEQTADAARDVFALIAEARRTGSLDKRLRCELRKDSFQRLVR